MVKKYQHENVVGILECYHEKRLTLMVDHHRVYIKNIYDVGLTNNDLYCDECKRQSQTIEIRSDDQTTVRTVCVAE